MKLVLAEKPSVAQSIAKVLGANKRFDGYLEGNGYVVSWCVGHLVELFEPEGYDEKFSKWNYEDLPIVPDEWRYQVSAGTRKQFGVIRQLMKRDDVESLVCATDAGREGELIFRLVYHQCRCKKPFERLWISSMEDSAIREEFANLKPSTEYDALYEAALSQERARLSGMMKNDFICRSCVNGKVVVVGKKETVQLIVDELQDMKNTLEEIAGQLLVGKMVLSKEEFSKMEKAYLALIITVIEIVNGAAYLFEESAENK